LLARAALAHLVTGFVQRQPALVKTAGSILQQLPASPDTAVARGVCEVLLGTVDGALDLLYAAERCAGEGRGGKGAGPGPPPRVWWAGGRMGRQHSTARRRGSTGAARPACRLAPGLARVAAGLGRRGSP
jgi:hypothetical protein